jgi:hypothetical protein
VRAVTEGCRKTLVLEFWAGEEERHCGHRCPQPAGRCGHTALADGLFD